MGLFNKKKIDTLDQAISKALDVEKVRMNSASQQGGMAPQMQAPVAPNLKPNDAVDRLKRYIIRCAYSRGNAMSVDIKPSDCTFKRVGDEILVSNINHGDQSVSLSNHSRFMMGIDGDLVPAIDLL